MAKIPFDIKYRPQIESGEYKVCIKYDWPVEILSWDCIHVNIKGERFPILAKITCMNLDTKYDFIHWYNNEGKYDPWDGVQSTIQDNDYVAYRPGHDLFVITPEEELTPFEQEVSDIVEYCKKHGAQVALSYAKQHAKTLLNFAREELVGEMLTSVPKESALYKAGVLDGKAEALKEIEQDLESSYAFKRGVEYGKEEILKDLPRWREWGGLWGDSYGLPIALVHDDRGFRLASVIGVGEKEFIMLDDLKKLPGFKEE